ncbi:uncharacterized protein LOC106167205 [Lingula anatina]|uniref:Uncharacterized protein LOC106167205 n=1 Tax=Lingula anatina TaxID=7574 RepID=A0A1S3IT49_LINAN|nr:uncharacterized protein LOC106167205 [Lingula anatina]|eukprot:XP_013401385.1 uncharacterized protein LOC106167205 [Lingula anatina]
MCSSPTSVQTECKLQIAKTVPIALDNSEEPTENFSFAEDFREITEIKERIGSFFKVAKRRKSQDLNSSTDSFSSEHSPQYRGRKYSYSMTLWPVDAPNTHAHREEFLEEEQQSKIYKLANTVKMLHEKLLREKQRKEELLNYCAKCEEGCLLQVDRMVDLFKRRVHTLERKASHFETMAKRARREKELVQKSHLQTTKMLQDSLETIKTELDNVRANNVELAKRTNKLNDEKNSLKRRIHDMDIATYAKADLKELELEVSNVRILYELALDRLKLYEGGLTKRYRQDKFQLHEGLPVVNIIPCSGQSGKDHDVTVSDDVQNEDDVKTAYSGLSTPGSNRNMSPSCEADVSESDQEDDEGTTDSDKIGDSFLATTKISPTLVANGAVKQMSAEDILTPQTDKPPTVQKSTSLPNESMLAVLARLERLHRTNKQTPCPELEASAESLPTNINLNTKNQEMLAEESEFDENVSMCEENYFRNISSDPDLSDAERRSSANSNDCDLNSSSASVLRRSSSGSTFSRIRNRRNGVVAGTIGPLPLLMGGKQSRKSKDFTNVLKHFNINRGSVMTPQRRRKSSKIASMMSISQACEEGGEG